MRCPGCGAANPADASWCGQCHRRFEPHAQPGAQPGRQREPTPAGPSATAAAVAQRSTSASAPAATGTFRRDGDGVVWACPECAADNPLAADHCAVCGHALRLDAVVDAPAVDWRRARLLSAVAPGAGHLAAGRASSGVARALLFCVWLAGGGLLLRPGPALLVAAPFLAAAVVLWVGCLVDLRRLERGRPELLAGRGLLWLVVGVLGLSGLGAAAGFAGLAG